MRKIFFLLLIFPFLVFAQHENDNWVNGNWKWKFDNAQTNGFVHTLNTNNFYSRYISSVVSDKNTGDLLFYCDGHTVYNKNNNVMVNGNDLFGISTMVNSSDQSSIILPNPQNINQYYLFYIAGNRLANDHPSMYINNVSEMGLRYAIIDMSLNGGLGEVITKNNILFNNSGTNALTSTFANTNNSFWVVSGNNGQFFSYKLDANGLNTTPVVSNGVYGSFIKISPNGKKLVTRVNGVNLYDFNNVNGTVSNMTNITQNLANSSYYTDDANTPNSAEFSSDSNILYFINSESNLCGGNPPSCPYINISGISMYNISLNTLSGGLDQNNTNYKFPLQSSSLSASLQLATNGKIYLIQNEKNHLDMDNQRIVTFGATYVTNGQYYSYNWGVINNPDNWNPTINPVSYITPPINTRNGFSLPQLIPFHQSLGVSCPEVYELTSYETNDDYTYYASDYILTHTNYYNENKTITFNAGNYIHLMPNTLIKSRGKSSFLAMIEGCPVIQTKPGRNSRSTNISSKIISQIRKDITLFPNPNDGKFRISLPEMGKGSFQIIDYAGKIIYQNSFENKKEIEVNIPSLVTGNYIVNVVLNNKKFSNRFIKK